MRAHDTRRACDDIGRRGYYACAGFTVRCHVDAGSSRHSPCIEAAGVSTVATVPVDEIGTIGRMACFWLIQFLYTRSVRASFYYVLPISAGRPLISLLWRSIILPFIAEPILGANCHDTEGRPLSIYAKNNHRHENRVHFIF